LDKINYKHLDKNKLFKYDLVILGNQNLPDTHQSILREFLSNYGHILVMAPEDEKRFNQLLQKLGLSTSVKIDTGLVYLNKINYKAKLFEHVFMKEVKNFAYPYIKKHYQFSKSGSWLYKLSDASAFAQVFEKKGQIFIINTPINKKNTNFADAPSLIVPLFYQIGLSQRQERPLYYTLGENNRVRLKIKNQGDEVVHLRHKKDDIIPYQLNKFNHIELQLNKTPIEAGIYQAVIANDTIKSLAFNYSRRENRLKFLNLPSVNNVYRINSVKQWHQIQKKWKNKKTLWAWFLLIALVFLIIEMILLKYWQD